MAEVQLRRWTPGCLRAARRRWLPCSREGGRLAAGLRPGQGPQCKGPGKSHVWLKMKRQQKLGKKCSVSCRSGLRHAGDLRKGMISLVVGLPGRAKVCPTGANTASGKTNRNSEERRETRLGVYWLPSEAQTEFWLNCRVSLHFKKRRMSEVR